MLRTIGAATLLGLAALIPVNEAGAQDPFSVFGGAAAGAAVGGAVTGRAGGAVAGAIIGGATAAAITAGAEQRQSNYYWYKGQCYVRVEGGYQRVPRGNCG